MLLYRLAKWMEERARLSRMISDAQGDVSQFVLQKEWVEKQMLAHVSETGELGQTDAEQSQMPTFAEQGDSYDTQMMAGNLPEPIRPEPEKQWV